MQMGLVYLVSLVLLDILTPTGSACSLVGAAIFHLFTFKELRSYVVKELSQMPMWRSHLFTFLPFKGR